MSYVSVTNCPRGGCFRFTLRTSLDVRKIGTAELRLYYMPDRQQDERINQTIIVSLLQGRGRPKRIAQQTTSRVGWVSVNMSRAIQYLLNRSVGGTYEIQITCENCRRSPSISPVATKKEYEPFLIIRTRKDVVRRSRRAVTDKCHSGSCCLHKVTLDFRKINWSNWILLPDVFEINFCTGTCQTWGKYKIYHTDFHAFAST